MSCSISQVKQLAKLNSGISVCVFTQSSCPHCGPFLSQARRELAGTDIKIIEWPLEQEDCFKLSQKYKVRWTPHALLFSNGSMRGTVEPDKRGWTPIVKKIEKMQKASRR